jgi:hypothetical protein
MIGGMGCLPGQDNALGTRHVYVSLVFIAYWLYEGEMFFVRSHLARIPVSATGIPA